MKRSEILFGIVRVPADFIVTILAFLLSYEVRTRNEFHFLFGAPTGPVDPLNVYIQFSFFAALVLVSIFALEGMYSLKSTYRLRREMRRIIFLCATWFMVLIAYFFVFRIQFFSRLILGYALIFTILFIILTRFLIRMVQRYALSKGIGKRRAVFMGNNSVAHELYTQFMRNPSYEILGVIGGDDYVSQDGLKLVGNIEDLKGMLSRYEVDEVIQTQSDVSSDDAVNILELCHEYHVTYRFVPDLLDVQRGNIDMNFHKGIPVITLRETPLDAWGRVAKRIFDFVTSSIALVILSPVLVIVAVLVKLDSRGPVFYVSKRVTTHGRTFGVYKFRSMVVDADEKKEDLVHLSHRDGPLFKVKNDPRVTRIGGFLRKTSLDEIPQLFNVFMGSMSLVGPRPHLPSEVAQYEKHHKKVLAVKPGITGMAQISGRSDLSFDEEVKLDTYYIENWSLWLDIVILFKTIPVVFKGDAAD